MATARTSKTPADEKTSPAENEAQHLTEPLQKSVDEAEDRGLLGVEVDPTNNTAYTYAGVIAGEPTPETDPDHARNVRQRLDDDARQR